MCNSTVTVSDIVYVFSVQVRSSTVSIQEGGVHLELTIVDTPGFGDVVDNSNWLV